MKKYKLSEKQIASLEKIYGKWVRADKKLNKLSEFSAKRVKPLIKQSQCYQDMIKIFGLYKENE